MKLSAECMACMVKRQAERLDGTDREGDSLYMREVLKLIANAPPEASAPVVTGWISRLHQKMYGTLFSFQELKKSYNELLLLQEESLARQIRRAEDPLRLGLLFARAGNYIDFGAMGSVDNQKLAKILEGAATEALDDGELESLKADLAGGKHLAYCADNCGEIVLDKLLIQEIKRLYPHLEITVLVRGQEVLNDATLEDARNVGLTDLVRVIGNGTEIAGTDISTISQEAREALCNADMVISKGQGNFETLHGCGLNIYYLFLCKCDWFTRRFGLERFHGVFVNERNQKIS